MTTTHKLFSSPLAELTLDSKMLMEFESYPGQLEGYVNELSTNANGALDIACRIMYAVWTVNPELAESRVQYLAEDIPTVYNLMNRHK